MQRYARPLAITTVALFLVQRLVLERMLAGGYAARTVWDSFPAFRIVVLILAAFGLVWVAVPRFKAAQPSYWVIGLLGMVALLRTVLYRASTDTPAGDPWIGLHTLLQFGAGLCSIALLLSMRRGA